MYPMQLAAQNLSEIKQKAIEDAAVAHSLVVKECADDGTDLPPYQLQELIGKGSFGRVYRATSDNDDGQLVAVKIISIEDGDTVEPGAVDTLNDILREVNTLKALKGIGAKNINAVIDTLLVGHSVWMVTEYCAGGSVASLMRPTGGLAEKWIIPILREVAEALYWVHKHGIIHRDIKCANVLITEDGSVQLCDFGVAGIIETKFDKRSTMTGTLHWMAPELFDSNIAYGIEVDVWAFGSMAFEIASGQPPNAATKINTIQQFGSYLKQCVPRLQGDKFSELLKDLVAFCLVEDPTQRPLINHVQEHPYIRNTEEEYPTSSLSRLVSEYNLWEAQGGSRQSLFSPGGAQGRAHGMGAYRQSGWDFGDYDEAGELTIRVPDIGEQAHRESEANEDDPNATPLANRRRRRPPPNIKELKVPLEKVFDRNTISTYDDNSKAFYCKISLSPVDEASAFEEPPTSRDSLIDLDAAFDNKRASLFIDMDTIKPALRPLSTDFTEYLDAEYLKETKRRTQEWKFPPSILANLGADSPGSRGSPGSDSNKAPLSSTSSQYPYMDSPHPTYQPNRDSSLSLIDLDACYMNDPYGPMKSPCSMPGSAMSAAFDLDSVDMHSLATTSTRAPSLYVDDDTDSIPSLRRQFSDLASTPTTPDERPDAPWGSAASGLGILPLSHPLSWLPPLPKAPSLDVMQGMASQEELTHDLKHMMASLKEHLEFACDWLDDMKHDEEQAILEDEEEA